MSPQSRPQKLVTEIRRRGVFGTLKVVVDYLRWRGAGSPKPAGPLSLADWHEAFGDIGPAEVGNAKFSIICPVHDTPAELLRECVASVATQTYTDWELLLVDDASSNEATIKALATAEGTDERIRSIRLDHNVGIAAATNAGAERASGEFLVFLDHDDLLAPTALAWLSSCANGADLIYTDEDKVYDDGTFDEAFFKPAWSPRLLLSVNYVNHITCVRAELFRSVGGLRLGFDGVQDHDLLLRLSEQPLSVVHLPNLLYHWRAWSGSVAGAPSSKVDVEARGIAVIQDAIDRRGWDARADLGSGSPFNYRVLFRETDRPLVKVVIPTRDHVNLLSRVVEGLHRLTGGVELHTVIVDNGSIEEATHEYFEQIVAGRQDITIHRIDDAFNFSRLCNEGVAAGPEAPYVLLLNNDVEMLHRDWLQQLLGWLQDPAVGAVGPKLLFPNGTIQHAGVILGFGGIAGHYAAHQPNQPQGGSLHDQAREVGCLTAACLLLRSEDYSKIGGMNESLRVDFQDVDFCLRLRSELGRVLVYDPTYPLVHLQSATRKTKDAVSGYTVARMEFLWGPQLTDGDPYYSPHLSLNKHDLSLRQLPLELGERSARLSPRVVAAP
jgi:GT2 family glycosyltransferase